METVINNKLNELKHNIKQLKEELLQNSCNTPESIHDAFAIPEKCCDSDFKIILCGCRNVGKSMLASLLLNKEIKLPCEEDEDVNRITRIVYSHENYIRKYKLPDSCKLRLAGYKEKSVSSAFLLPKLDCYEEIEEEFIPNTQNLKDHICLDENKRMNCQEFMKTIVEIGIPSNLLKCGVQLIDCPSFDYSHVVSNWIYAILAHSDPALVIYLYDHTTQFRMTDGEIIDKLNMCLRDKNKDLAHCVSYILVENKIDVSSEVNENEFDSTLDEPNDLDVINRPDEKAREIGYRCEFKTSRRFSKSRLFPVKPLSTAKIYMGEDDPFYETLLMDLLNEISAKIDKRFQSFIDVIALQLNSNTNAFEVNKDWLHFWLNLKSKSCDPNIIKLFNENAKILLDFEYLYKVFGIDYFGHPMQITQLCKAEGDNEDDYVYEMRRIIEDNMNQVSVIYFIEEESKILICTENKSHERLFDLIPQMQPSDILDMINRFALHSFQLNNRNFRPDSLFIDREYLIMNNHVPNNPKLSFVGINSKCNHLFYLHPEYQNVFPEFSQLFDITIYTLGWCIWILIEGKGSIPEEGSCQTEWLEMLMRGRFPDYPAYLRDCMIYCWNQTSPTNKDNLYRLNVFLDSNYWIQPVSLHSESYFQQTIQTIDLVPILDFNDEFKVYAAKTNNRNVLMTCLINRYNEMNQQTNRITNLTEERFSFDLEKMRIWRDNMRQEDKTKVYIESDESNLFVVHLYMPSNCRRLLDCLEEIDINILTTAIKDFIKENEYFNYNFRPDSVFIDKNHRLHYVNSIPNRPDIPFLLKNGKKTEPFHLHEETKTFNGTEYVKHERDLRKFQINQNVFGFGWLVWFILEGSAENAPPQFNSEQTVEKWIESFVSNNKHKNEELIHIMTECLSVSRVYYSRIWKKLRRKYQ